MKRFSDEQSTIIANRLKELRIERKLSHEKLKDELEKEGFDISLPSLKNYEIPAIEHSKAHAVDGMSIFSLVSLAKFYNVSVGYILGETDYRSPVPELKAECEYTGLSEDAAKNLNQIHSKSEYRAFSALLSLFIEDDNFEYLLGLLEGYITATSLKDHHTLETMSVIEYSEKDLTQLAINNTVKDILDRITVDFLSNNEPTELQVLKRSIDSVRDDKKQKYLQKIEELAAKYQSIIDNKK